MAFKGKHMSKYSSGGLATSYNTVNSGDYGTVPGNGSPTADDKTMRIGRTHIVSAENAHIARRLLDVMGYDSNRKVSMNQGGADGREINISSKEVVLNEEQLKRLQNEFGIDPEMLSPNSPYNERIKGGTTKDTEGYVDRILRMRGC
jgi:hypothetical protein